MGLREVVGICVSMHPTSAMKNNMRVLREYSGQLGAPATPLAIGRVRARFTSLHMHMYSTIVKVLGLVGALQMVHNERSLSNT
jgi:hypothetical protein